jgi:hypothetical protein
MGEKAEGLRVVLDTNTGDRDLLAHADEVPFAIESPSLFIRRFE